MFVKAAVRAGQVRHHQPDVRGHQAQAHPDQHGGSGPQEHLHVLRQQHHQVQHVARDL